MDTSEPGEDRALADIEKYGCHILHVLEEDNLPAFSYSIGIEKTSKQPELIVTGLKRDVSQFIINEYNSRVKTGEVFVIDEYYSNFIEGFEITLRAVEKTYFREYFGWALWLYGGENFRVFQLIYPSTSGIWPWDKEATEDFKWCVPRLYAT